MTTTSAVPPTSVCGGTRKFTWLGETKKISAARPLTVTVVPPTLVGNDRFGFCGACIVVFASAPPRATAMLLGATAFVVEGSLPKAAPFTTVSVPNGGRAGVPVE